MNKELKINFIKFLAQTYPGAAAPSWAAATAFRSPAAVKFRLQRAEGWLRRSVVELEGGDRCKAPGTLSITRSADKCGGFLRDLHLFYTQLEPARPPLCRAGLGRSPWPRPRGRDSLEAEPSNPHSPLPQIPRPPCPLQAPGLHFPEYLAATSLPGRPLAQNKGSRRLATQPEIPGGAPEGWGREAGKAQPFSR